MSSGNIQKYTGIIATLSSMDGKMVISTYPDQPAAERAARLLVKELKLAACVNLVKIKSCYIWKNSYEEAEECLAIFKTVEEKIETLKKTIESQHPYEVPEVVEIALKDINNRYLGWMKEVTSSTQT